MRTTNLFRIAALSLALVAPAISVAYANGDGRDSAGNASYWRHEEAVQAQLLQEQQQHNIKVAQTKAATATDAGAIRPVVPVNPFLSGPDRSR